MKTDCIQKVLEINNPKMNSVKFGNELPLTLIAGPCAMESREHALEMAIALKEISVTKNINIVYKSSFDKANRTSIKANRGIGIDKALEVFNEIKEKTKLPVITDVHSPEHCAKVTEVVDILQIPAFLCRQTDLLVAAAKTGKIINVKKGQFLSPWDMSNVFNKLSESGNSKVMLCERGTCFGYNNLVNDMRGLSIMQNTGQPIIFDATHSVQQPGGNGTSTGGDRKFVEPLARAAVAIGIAGVFLETHQNPDKAPSDGPNMVVLKDLPNLLDKIIAIDNLVKKIDNDT